jgi:hypothetical protein
MKYENNTGLPSISDIINPFEDTRWFKEEHSTRGNVVHGWVCADLMGMFTPDIPEAYSGYIKSYLEFKPHIVNVVFVERRLTSERGFCGKPDIVALLDDTYDNQITVLDWKTSAAAYITWQARIGGYFNLIRENKVPVKAGATVRLRKEPINKGYFPLVNFYNEAEMRENEIDFLCAFRTYSNVLKDGQIHASYETTQEEF